jgi:putative spermidine/putrescine transport system ATP-binding protein
MAGVTINEVRKSYGAVHALDHVSLEVGQGEMVALLGPSGCGKTTLLRSVAGLERPDAGRILIGGADVTDTPTRQRPIGMVFQSYALFPNLTLRQNIAFPLEVRGQAAATTRARVDELLELVHLGDQAERYPSQISGGQQQRAALARALAPAPQVLLLDEPLSALDALVRLRLRDEIRRIQQAVKITALYVTHDQSEAMAIADRVAVMNRGRVEQIAQPPELYEAPSTRFSATFVGNRNALELPVQAGRLRLGATFDMPAPPEAGSEALIFFRPEDVEVSADGSGQLATVESRIFQGLLTRLYLRVEADGRVAQIYADLPSRQLSAIEPGSEVRIVIAPEHLRVFPAA